VVAIWTLLRRDAPARRFFLAYGQSSLGTGAGYVAVLAIAYSRWESPWSVPLALIAETAPVILLGPILGALADRIPRRTCMIASDIVRAVAFAGIALVPSYPALIAFVVLAGAGYALFNAAALAALPSLTAPERQPAATSLFSAVGEAGYVVGPLLAVPLLVSGGGGAIAGANAASFAASALLLVGLPHVPRGEPAGGPSPSLLRLARDGLGTAMRIPGVAALMLATTIAVIAFGAMNAGELLLVRDALDAGNAALAILVAASGVGIVGGALLASGNGPDRVFRRRYLLGLGAASVGLVAAAIAPDVPTAAAAFLLAGAGNGYAVASERVLLQRWVPDVLRARVFGAKHALVSSAMMASYVIAGAALVVLDVRLLFAIAGIAGLLACAIAVRLLRGVAQAEHRKAGAAGGALTA
jgi:MFS family permease